VIEGKDRRVSPQRHKGGPKNTKKTEESSEGRRQQDTKETKKEA
jgi:hypothetical protein